jgi:hypothetical protein
LSSFAVLFCERFQWPVLDGILRRQQWSSKTDVSSMAEANADAPPVSMVEALERRLPHCDNNPHKVAAQLDAQHRNGDVRLLGGKVPGANPTMLGVKAHISSDGRAILYVQVRKALAGNYPIWDGEATTSKHHEFWAFERESFDAHAPKTADKALVNPGDRAVPLETEPAEAEPAEPEPRQRPAHRVPRKIPRWTEAMEELKRQRERRLDLAEKPTEQARSVARWLGKRGVEIVEPSSERAKDAELNPHIIVLSERQLIRRINKCLEPPRPK